MISNLSPLLNPDNNTQEVEFKAPEDRTTLDRDDFMHLFITQLQYQDPMNPMDSADMSTQLAQFNMVDLLYQSNESMERLVESDESRTRLQAVSFLGHSVRYEGHQLKVGPDGPMPFELELQDPAASCVVTIKDEEGRLIRSWDIGKMSSGRHPLDWDGNDAQGRSVAQGTYNVTISALDETGEEVKVTTWTTGVVSGLTYPDKGLPLLAIENGPEIALDKVWMVGP